MIVLSALVLLCGCGTEPANPDAGAGSDAVPAIDATAHSSDASAEDADVSLDAGVAVDAHVPDVPPDKPPALVSYVTGNAADALVLPQGPGLILMGGGRDVDAAFAWWRSLVNGGDVVVLRASGADGYNDYLYAEIGGVDSVETLLVNSRPLAESDYVAWKIEHAEGIFIAGGDQASYLRSWMDTALERALRLAWSRKAVIGGTSAGLAILGNFMFAAYNGSVTSAEALQDPYNTYVTLERDFLDIPMLRGIITDSHFRARDRMGRLVAFLARIVEDDWASSVLGLGVEERTALVVGPDGVGRVLGDGPIYVVRSNGMPGECAAGRPLTYASLRYHVLASGDEIHLPMGTTTTASRALSVTDGVLSPSSPY